MEKGLSNSGSSIATSQNESQRTLIKVSTLADNLKMKLVDLEEKLKPVLRSNPLLKAGEDKDISPQYQTELFIELNQHLDRLSQALDYLDNIHSRLEV